STGSASIGSEINSRSRSTRHIPASRSSCRPASEWKRRTAVLPPAKMADPTPRDLELERAVLGAALYSADVARQVADVDPEIFELDAHVAVQRAFRAIAPALNGAPPDHLTVRRRAESFGQPIDPNLFAQLLDEGINVVRVDDHLERLRMLAAAR